MVLLNSASRARNYTTVSAANTGGGPNKEGTANRVGRDSWTSGFFKFRRLYPSVCYQSTIAHVPEVTSTISQIWVKDNTRTYLGKNDIDYESYTSANTNHVENNNYDTNDTVKKITINGIPTVQSDSFRETFKTDYNISNNVLTYTPTYYSTSNQSTPEYDNLALPLNLDSMNSGSVSLTYFKMVESTTKYFAFVGLIGELFESCNQAYSDFIFQIYVKNNKDPTNNDWTQYGNDIIYANLPMDIDTNTYSNRSGKYSYLYRFYFVMKIPEPTANEKVTIKFMKSFINGGDNVSPTNIDSITDNYFLE
jgi:hypothetical protein